MLQGWLNHSKRRQTEQVLDELVGLLVLTERQGEADAVALIRLGKVHATPRTRFSGTMMRGNSS